MLNGGELAWLSTVAGITTYVGYQAGSLKSTIAAERNYRDPETKLLTRKGFSHRALRLLRRQEGAMVVMVDLNGLKKVNDTLGHDAGDAFIRAQADRLSEWAEQNGGFAARFGGDEFVAIIKGSSDHKLLKELLTVPVLWEGESMVWSAAVGAAWVRGGLRSESRREYLSNALKRADRYMYEDKTGGRTGSRR